MNLFQSSSLSQPVQQGLEKMAFQNPTPIQAAAIPLALENKDLLACAQTGTGKTVAFAIPVLEKILANPKAAALIVVPTRELATQIWEVFAELTHFCPRIGAAILIGGASMNRQLQDLKHNPAIVIGTPGRLIDHLERKSLNFGQFKTIVLDEADRMFDMGFKVPMDRIFKALSKDRQTLLFSATFSNEVVGLAQKYMRSPERVSVGEVNRPITKIKQTKINVAGPDKNQKILEEIQAREGQTLVFVRTKIRTDRLAKFLKANGMKVASIHGGRTQSQREIAMSNFRSGNYRVLIATDLASRGIDIPDIQTVFNFDLPEKAEDYVHRIGRTARAGAEGEAVSFVTPEEVRDWNYLMKKNAVATSTSGYKPHQKNRPQERFQKRGGAPAKKPHGKVKKFFKFFNKKAASHSARVA